MKILNALNIEQAAQTAIEHQKAGRLGEAVVIYRRILALRPDFVMAHNNLGNALASKGKIDQAIMYYRQALLLKPDYAEAAHNLAAVCQQAGRLEQAVAAYHDVLQLKPKSSEVHNNLAIALCGLTRYDEAIGVFRRALALRSAQPQTYNNLGNALTGLGLYDEAIGAYHRALALRPNYPAAHLNLGLILLCMGNFVRGWPEYEWRWRIDDPRSRLHLKAPWWDGGNLGGRTVLVHNEQGFGDTIQFVRYMPAIAAMGGKVVLMCQPALMRLIKQVKGINQLIPAGQSPPKHDVHCPLLTMPGVVGTTLNSIPASIPYLSADPALVERWKSRVPSDGRLKVGVVWAGQPTHANDRNRSLNLSQLADLARVLNVWYCSLQKGKATQQIFQRPVGLELTDWTKELKDFADTAGLVANLDLIICVDTSVAHLAGAMGKPVWVLIPYVPDWRWLLERSDTPWYPTMRLFRQRRRADWGEPIAELVQELRNLANQQPHSEKIV